MKSAEIIKIEKLKKYLPSKKLARILGGSAVVVILVLVISSYFGNNLRFLSGKKNGLVVGTVGEAIGKDSNNNGIPDWEESLWGFDPKGNGKENKVAIEAKKQAAKTTSIGSGDDIEDINASTPTGAFSRDLLSSMLALQQAGSLTPEAIANIAASIGQTFDTKRGLTPTYKITDVTLASGDLNAARIAYKKNFQTILNKYKNSSFGSEFDIIAEGLGNSTEDSALATLPDIATDYTNFAKDVLSQKTPKDAAVYALELANASQGIANSLRKIALFRSDVMTGLVGMDEYTKSSNSFTTATSNLGNYFGESSN